METHQTAASGSTNFGQQVENSRVWQEWIAESGSKAVLSKGLDQLSKLFDESDSTKAFFEQASGDTVVQIKVAFGVQSGVPVIAGHFFLRPSQVPTTSSRRASTHGTESTASETLCVQLGERKHWQHLDPCPEELHTQLRELKWFSFSSAPEEADN